MATSYTTLLGFAKPQTGDLSGTWGDVVNESVTQLVEDSVAGVATVSVASGNWTLTTTGSGADNQARKAILIPTGSPGVSRDIIAPGSSKAYIVINQSDAAVVLKSAATAGVTIATGTSAVVAWNGSGFVNLTPSLSAYLALAGGTMTGNLTLDAYTEKVATLATSGSIALNPATGTTLSCAAAAAGTVTFTDGLSSGQSISLLLTGGSSATINWPSGTTWVTAAGNTAPTLSASNTLVFWKISSTLYGALVGKSA